MSIKPSSLFRLCGRLFDKVSFVRSFDLAVEDERTSIKLTAANKPLLPKGRYLLLVSICPREEDCVSSFGINLGVAERVLPFTLEFGRQRAYVPVVLTQDLLYLTVFAEPGMDILADAKWRVRPMAYVSFYAFLSFRAGWRLLLGKENKRLFLDAISRNGVSGFGGAVRGDWEAALRLSHSGFTRRLLHYPEAVNLPKRAPVRVSGLAVVGDLSTGADLPHIDEALLQRASLAGLSALCLPCKWEDGEFYLPVAVRRFLENASLNFPFFFCCSDIEQEDVDRSREHAFAEAISEWFDDLRYFRVDERPVVAVRARFGSSDVQARVDLWREVWSAAGKSALIVAATLANGLPPRLSRSNFIGALASNSDQHEDEGQEERRREVSLPDTPPARFGRLVHAAMHTKLATVSETSLVFVDFGGVGDARPCLTEDERYGYAWVESLRVAQARCAAFVNGSHSPLRVAVAVHAFYPELLDEILERLHLNPTQKLFVTTTGERRVEVEQVLRDADANYVLRVFENRGRDVLPFMKIYDEIVAEGFDVVVKIHTKKSVHRGDGDAWRRSLIGPILDDGRFARILTAFERDPSLGMTGSKVHLTSMGNNIVVNEARVFGLARRLGLTHREVRKGKFFAGSMFVARVSALAPLMSLAIDDEDFEPEAGQLDGTMAHAVERGFALSVISCGMRLAGLNE